MFNSKLGILIGLSACFVYINSEGVGTSCFVKEDCGLWHFVCENGVCKCDDEHITDKDNKWCAVDIQQACGYHDTCYDENAECVGVAIPKYGSCECKKGYTLHNRKRVCSVVIGNNCTISDDCIEGSCRCQTGTCNYTQCFCDEPLQANVNRSKCLPALHDDCSKYNECARENSICNDKKVCQCAVDYKEAERKGEIYCLAMLNNTCNNAADCADVGAICAAKCVCGEGYVRQPDVSTCLKVATDLNDTCIHDIQCSTFSGFGSQCLQNKCVCKTGFYFDIDFKRCVRSCLCGDNEVNKIKKILKELTPAFEILSKNNNMDLSKVIRKIKNW